VETERREGSIFHTPLKHDERYSWERIPTGNIHVYGSQPAISQPSMYDRWMESTAHDADYRSRHTPPKKTRKDSNEYKEPITTAPLKEKKKKDEPIPAVKPFDAEEDAKVKKEFSQTFGPPPGLLLRPCGCLLSRHREVDALWQEWHALKGTTPPPLFVTKFLGYVKCMACECCGYPYLYPRHGFANGIQTVPVVNIAVTIQIEQGSNDNCTGALNGHDSGYQSQHGSRNNDTPRVSNTDITTTVTAPTAPPTNVRGTSPLGDLSIRYTDLGVRKRCSSRSDAPEDKPTIKPQKSSPVKKPAAISPKTVQPISSRNPLFGMSLTDAQIQVGTWVKDIQDRVQALRDFLGSSIQSSEAWTRVVAAKEQKRFWVEVEERFSYILEWGAPNDKWDETKLPQTHMIYAFGLQNKAMRTLENIFTCAAEPKDAFISPTASAVREVNRVFAKKR